MPFSTSYVFMVSMDVDADKEDLFNEVYDTEHIPYLLGVPGVRSVSRLKGQPFSVSIAGDIKNMPAPSPVYTAVYELDSPDVLTSTAWAEAVEKGRWSGEVRPYTHNRSHAIYEKMSST